MNKKTPKKYSNRTLIRRFVPYFRPHKSVLGMDLFFAALTTVCELALPLILRYLTDIGANDPASLTIATIGKLGVFYLALRVVEVVAQYYMQSIGHIMGAKIEKDMRKDVFSHLQSLSDAFYNNAKVGQIMSRITTDLFDITEFAHHCPEEFFIAGIKIGIAFLILLNVDVPLTLILFAMIPLMLLSSKRSRASMRHHQMEQRQQMGEINAGIEDSLLGVKVVKSFANEDIEKEKFEEHNQRFVDIKKDFYKSMASFHMVNRIYDGLMYAIIIVFGGYSMMVGRIQPGDLVAYVLYVTTLLTTVRRIVEFSEQFGKGMTGIERFLEIMDTRTEIYDDPNAEVLTSVKGNIEFEHVSFQYPGYDEKVLDDLTLSIAPGENIAIVGPSGGGKTTLSNLIPRFYDVTEGAIKVEGVDVRCITLSSLRNNIGMVQQDVYLFSGTVLENIAYGKPGASKEAIVEAAKLAGAYDFIDALPQGFKTYVGERGVKLSGGQKQRISIARVFLKNPPILILDEATSALDNASEKIIQESLETLAKGRTTITIAHRLSTIQNATRILVLIEGKVVESGNHDELMAAKGTYFKLYESGKNTIDEQLLAQ